MKTNRFATVLTVAALAASALVFSGCEQAASSAASANFAGTARYTFPVHQSGVVAEAVVSTDANGNVASATFNEWQGPSSWVLGGGAAGALQGFECIRMYKAGHNATSTVTGVPNYAFFYYDATTKGWVEFTPASGTWYAPKLGETPVGLDASNKQTSNGKADAAGNKGYNPVAGNFDLKMANSAYSLAYADDAASTDATKLVSVTFPTFGSAAYTVGDSAAVQVVALATAINTANTANFGVGALNKAVQASLYFPVSATNVQLGYKVNHDRMLAFFKKNPAANYAAAATKSVTWATSKFPTVPTSTNYLASFGYNFNANDTTYAATTDTVWYVGSATNDDAVTGATFSDFPAYAGALQTAYMEAVAEAKTGDLRSAN